MSWKKNCDALSDGIERDTLPIGGLAFTGEDAFEGRAFWLGDAADPK